MGQGSRQGVQGRGGERDADTKLVRQVGWMSVEEYTEVNNLQRFIIVKVNVHKTMDNEQHEQCCGMHGILELSTLKSIMLHRYY